MPPRSRVWATSGAACGVEIAAISAFKAPQPHRVATDLGVPEPGALLGRAVPGPLAGVDVEIGHRVGRGQHRGLRGQRRQHRVVDLLPLPHVTPREGAQERAQRRRAIPVQRASLCPPRRGQPLFFGASRPSRPLTPVQTPTGSPQNPLIPRSTLDRASTSVTESYTPTEGRQYTQRRVVPAPALRARLMWIDSSPCSTENIVRTGTTRAKSVGSQADSGPVVGRGLGCSVSAAASVLAPGS